MKSPFYDPFDRVIPILERQAEEVPQPMAKQLRLARRRIDRHVGSQIQRRRAARDMSERLATDIGVSATEIQNYETGRVRVPASRLWDIANALGSPISYFFSDARADGID